MWFNIDGELLRESEAKLAEEVLGKAYRLHQNTVIVHKEASPFIENLCCDKEKVFDFVDVEDGVFSIKGDPQRLWAEWLDYKEHCFQDCEDVKRPF